MRIRAPQDFWAGLFFVAAAAAFIVLSRGYGLGTMHRMGPGLFPTLIGALLALLGLVIAGRALAIDGPPLPQFFIRPVAVSVIAIALFGVALTQAGLGVAVGVLVLVGALGSGESRLWETLALTAFLIVFSIGVFAGLLGLPIPLWPWS